MINSKKKKKKKKKEIKLPKIDEMKNEFNLSENTIYYFHDNVQHKLIYFDYLIVFK